jgi:carboxylesterase type B
MHLSPFVLLLSICPVWALSNRVPVIKTTSGKLQGISLSDKTNGYLGIPYAAPPVGDLRFLAPRELNTPSVSRNATSFGPACVQLPYLSATLPSVAESEDCLTVNVWSSKNSTFGPSKPVFVWVYGGAWVVGGSNFPSK